MFCVTTRQLVYNEAGELEEGEEGINPPRDSMASLPAGTGLADSYPDSVILFNANFHILPLNTADYLEEFTGESLRKPVFSRSLSVRR